MGFKGESILESGMIWLVINRATFPRFKYPVHISCIVSSDRLENLDIKIVGHIATGSLKRGCLILHRTLRLFPLGT